MFLLTLTADLNGVTDLRPNDNSETPFWYTFKVRCTSCWEMHRNNVNISRFETHAMCGSRGESNLVWKCKTCKRESSASIKTGPVAYQQGSPPIRQSIIELDCRGLELTQFLPEGEWLATGGTSGSLFMNIDLSEGEWYDYDEKTGEEVSILDVKWEIIKK